MSWRIVEGDCLALMRELPPRSFDAVVTDPPWNLGRDYGRHDDRMPPEAYRAWLRERLEQCARVSRGVVVLMPGLPNLPHIDELLAAVALRRRATLWWGRREPRGRIAWEPVVWASRPGAGSRVPAARLLGIHAPPRDCAHPCPKPLALMRRLANLAAPAGGLLLDPFAGTGTILRAARELDIRALGIELDGRHCATAARRLTAARFPRRQRRVGAQRWRPSRSPTTPASSSPSGAP